jgi:hypothetical protein
MHDQDRFDARATDAAGKRRPSVHQQQQGDQQHGDQTQREQQQHLQEHAENSQPQEEGAEDAEGEAPPQLTTTVAAGLQDMEARRQQLRGMVRLWCAMRLPRRPRVPSALAMRAAPL